MTDSADLGLRSIAIGCKPATWSRFIALPLTSKMQCLLCIKKNKLLTQKLNMKQNKNIKAQNDENTVSNNVVWCASPSER